MKENRYRLDAEPLDRETDVSIVVKDLYIEPYVIDQALKPSIYDTESQQTLGLQGSRTDYIHFRSSKSGLRSNRDLFVFASPSFPLLDLIDRSFTLSSKFRYSWTPLHPYERGAIGTWKYTMKKRTAELDNPIDFSVTFD